MKQRKSLLETLCPYKLSAKEMMIVVWFCISLVLLTIADDAPIWLLLLVLANFASAAYCLHYIHLDSDDDE